MTATLADRIERRIRKIPASNPRYVSQTTIGTILSRDLLRKIAEVAAEEATAVIGKDVTQ